MYAYHAFRGKEDPSELWAAHSFIPIEDAKHAVDNIYSEFYLQTHPHQQYVTFSHVFAADLSEDIQTFQPSHIGYGYKDQENSAFYVREANNSLLSQEEERSIIRWSEHIPMTIKVLVFVVILRTMI
jgi:hypothetical protein